MKNSIVEYIKGYGFKSVVVLRALKVFIILFVLTTVLITISYNGIRMSSQKAFISENKAELKKATIIFENFFREAEYLSAKIFSNSDIKFFFSMNDKQELNSEQKEKLRLTLGSYYNTGIKNLYLYNPRNSMIFSSRGSFQKKDLDFSYWIDNIENGFTNGYKIDYQKSKKNFLQSLFFIKKLSGASGYIAVEIDIQKIKEKFRNLINADEEIYVLMNDDIVFSNTIYNDLQWLSKINSEEGYIKNPNLVYTKQSSYYYNFEYIACSSGLKYMSDIRRIYFSFIFIFIVVFILITAVSLFTSKDSLYYISNLINIFETKKAPRKLKDNEIKYIGDRIIYLMDDNEKLKKEVEMRVTDCEEMQNKALQKQITPHFINNSLTVIGNEMIKKYGYENECIKMLTKLSRIIKYSYISENVFVSLNDELAFLNDYMIFLKYRYRNFDYSIHCDVENEDLRILKMILQPFVENAVFYGIKDCGGEVCVTIKKNADNLEIIIYDNGVGMSNEKIEEIFEASRKESFENEKIGIKNVLKRLKLVYGENAKLSIQSKQGEFTEFKISISLKLCRKLTSEGADKNC